MRFFRLCVYGSLLLIVGFVIVDYIRLKTRGHPLEELHSYMLVELLGPVLAMRGHGTVTVAPHGCVVSGASGDEMSRIAELATLRILCLWEAQVGDNDLAKLEALQNLKELTLECQGEAEGNLTDTSLEFISQAFPSLEELSIANAPGITGERHSLSLNCLADLKSLSFHNCGITAAGLAQMDVPESLKVLWIVRQKSLTDSILPEIAELSNLRELCLARTSITGDRIMVLQRLKNLEELVLPRLSVSNSKIERLQQALPDCSIQIGPRE